jgi:hypothetical protein
MNEAEYVVSLAEDETCLSAVLIWGSSIVKSSWRSGRKTGPQPDEPLGEVVYCDNEIEYVCGRQRHIGENGLGVGKRTTRSFLVYWSLGSVSSSR